MNHNSVTMVGRLSQDPEFTPGKKTPSSDGVRTDDRIWCKLAVNRPKVKGKKTGTDYFCLCGWGRIARVFTDFCRKGKQVLIEGSLRTNPTMRPDGTWDNYTEIVVHKVILGADPKDNSSYLQQAPAFQAPQAQQPVTVPSTVPVQHKQVDAAQVAKLAAAVLAEMQSSLAPSGA